MNTLDEKMAPLPVTEYEFKVPEKIGGEEIKTITMTELSANAELAALKRAMGDSQKLGYELAKASLVAVNGEKLKYDDGSLDKTWNTMRPKVRSLILAAFNELHSPDSDSVSDFLKSQMIKV